MKNKYKYIVLSGLALLKIKTYLLCFAVNLNISSFCLSVLWM